MTNYKKYASLHNHTEYSNLRLLDSINKVKKMIDKAIDMGLSGLAFTDHEALCSHVEAVQYYEQKVKAGLNPSDFKLILGDECYLVPDACNEEKQKFYHFIILAKNEKGYRQLKEISSTAWENVFSYKGMDRVPLKQSQLKKIVGDNKGNLIGSTACIGGQLGQMILAMDEAEKLNDDANALKMKNEIISFITYCIDIFGSDDFYLEVQPSNQKDQIIVNERIKSIAKAFGLKIIYTTDSHFLGAEDRFIHKAYLNSQDGDREVDDFYATAYMMEQDEIKTFLDVTFSAEEFAEMTNNTIEIADKVEVYPLFQKQIIPSVSVKQYPVSENIFGDENREYINNMLTSEYDQDRYWVNTCINALHEKDKFNDLYLTRLNMEAKELWDISPILGERMTKYYNTMQKIIEITWDAGDSLVGPARGSATGYLSCYLLGITQLDPIEWNLPHWRHLTATRPELPDIDFDTQAMRRAQILQAVKDFFGSSNVLSIATFGTEGAKSSTITACRGYRDNGEHKEEGIDHDFALYLSGMIPTERGSQWPLRDVLYGNEEKGRKPVNAFRREAEQYEGLIDIMLFIEGIVNKRSVHASGVYIYNNGFLEHNALMKAPSGQAITQFNMNDSDYMGSLKYDFLTIEALDKIRVALDLLLEDGAIEYKGSLKNTYESYIHPDVLDYETQEMWDLMGSGEVINLFQFDTPVGAQCAKKIKPHSLVDAASANSLMRLMADQGAEQPADRYLRMKKNIQLWYDEMNSYGLTKEEVEILEPHYLPVYGTPNTQEDMMETLMNPKITNFDLLLANKARKIVAKKKTKEVAGFEELFYEKGQEQGCRKEFSTYIWNTCIKPQLGYSFSRNHTTPYTAIALQELNLYHTYPSIYWNTACLTVNAGSGDEDAEGKSTDYAKVASAIGDITSRGVKVSLADINDSGFGFKPNMQTNEIIFGLKGMNNVGDDVVRSIIAGRPYKSLDDFMERTKVNKQGMIALIKGGAFDKIEGCNRQEIMMKYITQTADLKKKLTLQNFNGLINAGLVPDELSFEVRVFNFNKVLKSNCKVGEYYALPEPCMKFYDEFFDTDILTIVSNYPAILQTTWDRMYKKVMDTAREWLKANQADVLQAYNNTLYMAEWDKYCQGSLSAWEMESVCFYYHPHELANVNSVKYGLAQFSDLPYEPEVDYYFKRGGKDIPIFKLTRIVGTVLGKNKTKATVQLLTTDGVVNVKFRMDAFARLDKQLSEKQSDGTKKVTEKSWFKRGSKIMITGFRREDTFVAKKYAKTAGHTVYKIDSVLDDGDILIRSNRIGEDFE